jgi:hypothetical protein
LQSQASTEAQTASEVLRVGIRWLDANLENFSLRFALDDVHRIQLLKPLGELVLLLELIGRRPEFRSKARDMTVWAWEEFERGELLLEVLAARPDLIMVATILASFHSGGLRNRKLARFIRYLSTTHYTAAIQLPNWRILDLRIAMSRLNQQAAFPRGLIGRMWSFQHPEPWLIDHDSAYAFTHEVFYVTDFGRAPRRYPRRTREYVALCLPAWLEIFHRKSDLDVFSELLMVGCCLRIEAPQGAYARILSPFKEHGFLPSPHGGGSSLLRPGMRRCRRDFLIHYHTTIVGLMAGLLMVPAPS